MKIHQFFFKKEFINITFPHMYEEFILWDINLVFLQYYHNTTYIHNYGYVSTFLYVFVAYYIIAISNFHKITPSITLYDILLKKSHRKLCGTIFFVHSSKQWPNNLYIFVIEIVEIWEKVVWPCGFCAWRTYIFHPPHNFFYYVQSSHHLGF
jgi:hypothetical protein